MQAPPSRAPAAGRRCRTYEWPSNRPQRRSLPRSLGLLLLLCLEARRCVHGLLSKRAGPIHDRSISELIFLNAYIVGKWQKRGPKALTRMRERAHSVYVRDSDSCKLKVTRGRLTSSLITLKCSANTGHSNSQLQFVAGPQVLGRRRGRRN